MASWEVRIDLEYQGWERGTGQEQAGQKMGWGLTGAEIIITSNVQCKHLYSFTWFRTFARLWAREANRHR